MAFVFLTGCDWKALFSPGSGPQKKVAKQQDQSAEPGGDFLTKGEMFSFHRWMVTEMIEQILGRAPKGQQEVDGWANVLSQRGSIEGVVNGMVLSVEYTSKEKGKTDIKAIRFFAQEMAALDHPNKVDSDPEVVKARETYSKEYFAYPLFALKRIMGDKILKESVGRKEDKENLAGWYANFAVRWNKLGVSFGMENRNKDNEAFHFRWAQENTLGMLQWELLNRIHRILNEMGGLKYKSSTNQPGK